MQTIYAYLGEEHFTQMLADAFAAALSEHGYKAELETGSAMGPHVAEYVGKVGGRRRLISLSMDHTRGEPGEAEVTLETEELDDEVGKVVAEGVLGLLADASKRLLESVDDAATRARIVDRLTEVLAGLK